MNFMSSYMAQVLGVVLVALLGYLGVKAKQLYTKYIIKKIHQNILPTLLVSVISRNARQI